MVSVPLNLPYLLLIAVVLIVLVFLTMIISLNRSSSSAGGGRRNFKSATGKAQSAASMIDPALAGMPLLDAANSMDPFVFDALDRWVVHSKGPWSLVDYVREHHATIFAPDNGFIDGLKGYVAESIVAEHYSALGHDVLLASTSNQPGWDLTIDGYDYQVKAGSTAAQAARHAINIYPNIPIITDPASAAHLQTFDPHAIIAVHELGAAHLEATTSHTLHGMEMVSNVGQAHFPFVSAAVSAFTELRLLIDDHTTFGRAAANVAIDVVGIGGGAMIGGKTGMWLGAVGHVPGMAVGAVIGSIFGGLAGRFGAKAIKTRKFKELVERYDLAIYQAQIQYQQDRQVSLTSFHVALKTWDSNLTKERRVRRRHASRGLQTMIAAKRRASLKLGIAARWAAFRIPSRRSAISAALRLLAHDSARGAAMLASIIDDMRTEKTGIVVPLKKRLAEFISIYRDADDLLKYEVSEYHSMVQRYDTESREFASNTLKDLQRKSVVTYSQATNLKEKIIKESYAMGKPIVVRPALPG